MNIHNDIVNPKPRSDIKLVVADLDGTLLDEHHRLSSATKGAVKQLVAKGFQFMVATGRHYQDVYLLAKQLDVDIHLITSNGARVHNHHGECLYQNNIPVDLVKQVLKISRNFSVHRNVYQEDVWLVEEPHEALLAIHHASGFGYQLVDFDKVNLQQVDKIYFTAEHGCLLKLEAHLKKSLNNHLNITFTSPEYLEVMNLGVNKGQALQRLLNQKGLASHEVLAFGDGMNDIEMLQLVDYGVVMDNASHTVKQALAGYPQALPNSQEGVATFLKTHLL